MGLYDRGYMRAKKPQRITPGRRAPVQESVSTDVPAWKRLIFRIWLRLQRRRGRTETAAPPLRLVVDTNTLVAARWKPESASARIMEMSRNGTIKLLLSGDIDREYRHILKKVNASSDFWDGIDELSERAEWLEPVESIRASEDPNDDMFLTCAVSGGANYIISSDQHLLALDGFRELCICTPTSFFHQADMDSALESEV